MQRQIQNNNKKGFLTLMAVLVAGTIGTALLLLFLALGTRQVGWTLTRDEGAQAKAGALACADLALSAINVSDTYTGSGSSTNIADSCTYVVTDIGLGGKDIISTGIYKNATRKVHIILSASAPVPIISSWVDMP